jgi:hypothetical protein
MNFYWDNGLVRGSIRFFLVGTDSIFTSFFLGFSSQIEMSKYIFRSLMRPWFLCLYNDSIVIIIKGYSINNASNHT